MLGLQELARANDSAAERQKGNPGGRLDKAGLINCLKHPGLIPQCSRCSNSIVCLEISQALNN
ncbi:MAG: hypothetical protein E3J60_00670 [Dehalococcoidia bacterium]|nr:MAG: hypothetical protein E3J60_00670 [Dehalococcoidia bacterium]